jgi:outer membrane protein TolC
MNVEDVIHQAFSQRSDLRAAEAQVRSAERARSAARAERLPSVSLTADYGAIGTTPDHSHGTFAVVGSLKVPIWQGGRVEGDIQQAEAALAQREAERDDLRGEIEADVRKSYLDLQAATREIEVSRENMEVSQQNLKLTRQRFDAGVADNLEVVQSQESIANAEMDYINSVFAHNVAKLSLARASGQAAANLEHFLKMGP